MDKKPYNEISSSDSTAKTIGIICVATFFCFGVAALVMSGVDFQTLHTRWAEGPWTDLAPVELACTIYVVVISLIGALVFTVCANQKMFVIVYAILLLLSLLFSWAIGIFASIGATIKHKVEHILGCNSELTGVLEMWKNVDLYLMYADSILCSDLCPCSLNKRVYQEFQDDYFAVNALKAWGTGVIKATSYNGIKKDGTLGDTREKPEFSFRNCPDKIREEAHRRYIENPSSRDHWIDPAKFATYWKNLENRFNCTGWCKTNYIDPYTSQNKMMFKFIFSNVNKGIVGYPGCLHRITNWLPSLLGAIGGCLIVVAFLQTITFIMALKLFSSPVVYSQAKVNPEKA